MSSTLLRRMALRHCLLAAWVCAAAACALSACTSTPQAAPDRDADAKRFAPHPASAAIYVYRPDLPGGAATQSNLWIDGRLIGQTLPRSYYRVDLRPGTHELRGDGPDQGALAVTTAAGQLYFVRLNVVAGTMRFALADPETGKQEIPRCCVLQENWAPGQRPLLR